MVHELADRRDVDFVVFEQLDIQNILENTKFDGLDQKTLERVITKQQSLHHQENDSVLSWKKEFSH